MNSHRGLLIYIAFCVTLLLISSLLELGGFW